MKYSFVIPCYRSEHTLSSVVSEIKDVSVKMGINDFEIILVNDCSPDNVWEVIKDLSQNDECIHGINFAKNFGQHAALLAGYTRTTGDIIVSLDDDGQTPIDELYKLVAEMENGNKDVVYAYYEEIKQTAFRKFGTFVATKMCTFFLDAPREFKGSSFYIAKRFVIDEIVKYDHTYPYLAGLILRTTRKIGYVQAHHRLRLEGESGYNFASLFSLWLNGFTAFSVKPLELGSILGVMLFLLGIVGGIAVVVNKIVHPDVLLGWSSLISLLMFIGGAIMLMLGLMGEYIGRIYICINRSPQYVVSEETKKQRVMDSENC